MEFIGDHGRDTRVDCRNVEVLPVVGRFAVAGLRPGAAFSFSETNSSDTALGAFEATGFLYGAIIYMVRRMKTSADPLTSSCVCGPSGSLSQFLIPGTFDTHSCHLPMVPWSSSNSSPDVYAVSLQLLSANPLTHRVLAIELIEILVKLVHCQPEGPQVLSLCIQLL